MRVKARALGLPAEDYFNDKMLDDGDLLYTGVAAAAGRLLGQAWQDHGALAAGRLHLLPHHRADRRGPAGQPVRLSGKRHQLLRAGARDPRQDRGAPGAARLHPRQERGVGRDRAQPRAELRAEPADGSGVRLRHADRPGRHRQDAAGAGRRAVADAGDQALHRDHRHARHGAGGRGHRLPARAPRKRRWRRGWARSRTTSKC